MADVELSPDQKRRAPRNRTVTLSAAERQRYRQRLLQLTEPIDLAAIANRIIHQDASTALSHLPHRCVDLLVVDPPYNLDKAFNSLQFRRTDAGTYGSWLAAYFDKLQPLLKPTASIYVCADWQSSSAVFPVVESRFQVRSRITWEREKGRGARRNWKNASEDLWFCTASNRYTFNLDAVKLKRRVIAPYTQNGVPKDWDKTRQGNFRLTHPSNLWTDLTVPFWSMAENTDHPTQKPEKLLAKLILASSNSGDLVLDPFLGSGTTAVVAKKLGRRYIGIEQDELYCCLAEKRLAIADRDPTIQGFAEGVFWERNSGRLQGRR